MITVLSGGTGAPKLLRGLRRLVPDADLAVVVNTGEDAWVSGGHLSPDTDTVLYLCAGILNEETWWGIEGDTFACHEALRELGQDEFIRIGDRDRAVHLTRGDLLRSGLTLTEATARIADRLGVGVRVLPMADAPYATHVLTDEGRLHFQEYWVRRRGALPVRSLEWEPATPPPASPETLAALEGADAVLVGPSNPVTSIGPILACGGVREALREAFVVAVSPFIGHAPVSGPAGALMAGLGLEPSSRGVHALYRDFCDVFVQDAGDPVQVPGAARAATLMTDPASSEALAAAVLELAGERTGRPRASRAR
ncbi:MAG: 2-phospho-L-lactate transferase [Methanospirillum sp.]|nr:2-phospho-L-lactate transferase [Methanospirillum sp.]